MPKNADNLDTEVRELLEKRRDDWSAISADKRSGVSVSWIRQFSAGLIKDPGYLRLRALRDYLRAKS